MNGIKKLNDLSELKKNHILKLKKKHLKNFNAIN